MVGDPASRVAFVVAPKRMDLALLPSGELPPGTVQLR
jgi:hypothetical protein